MTTMNLRRTTAAMITLLAAVGMVLAMSATAALAQYPTDEDFGVVCTPQNPNPGQTVSCRISGGESRENLSVEATTADGTVVYSDEFRANPGGHANFRISTEGLAGETVTVRATAEDTNREAVTTFTVRSERGVRTADERVTPAPTTERLPVTGGQALLLSVVGLSLVGGGLLALRKRGDDVA
jgi:LPXTG-motif cell wall-anchored protein